MGIDIFREIFEKSSAAMLLTSEDRNIVMVNDSFCKMTGYTKEELIGVNWDSERVLEDIARLRDYNQRRFLKDPELPEEYEICYYSKTGNLKYALLSVSLVEQTSQTICTLLDITERKAIEEEVRVTKEYYKRIVEYAGDVVFTINPDGYFTYISPVVIEKSGFQQVEITGMHFLTNVHPDDKNLMIQCFDYVIKKKEKISGIEFRAKHKNGEWRWHTFSASPIVNEKREVTAIIGLGNDITNCKTIEKALLRSETFLFSLLNNIPDVIWLKDPEGIYIACNEAYEKLVGRKMDEIVGGTDYDILSEEVADFVTQRDKNVIATNKVLRNEENLFFPGISREIFLDTIKTPVFGDKNELIGVLGIARDISERKQMEEKLSESQTKLRIALKLAHLGNWEYNFNEDKFYFNDTFYALYKANSKEMGETMSKLEYAKNFVHPEDQDVVEREMLRAIHSEEKMYYKRIEHRMLYANGEEGYVAVQIVRIMDEEGKPLKTFGINQDITAFKRAEKELRELNNMKDKFFSIIAHDLKNPFNSILGFSELLVSQIDTIAPEKTEAYANAILESSKKAMSLLTNILEWSRAESGRMGFNPHEIDLIETVNSSIDVLMPTAVQKNITLKLLQDKKVVVTADPEMLSTVFRNLISNALKFTYQGGEVKVLIEKQAQELLIKVIDNGVGISEHQIERLFRLDTKQSTLGTADEEGTGLGLMLCKEFVEKHGGKISVSSQIDKGSEFCVSLPV